MNPLTTSRNKYYDNNKCMEIYTPVPIVQFIVDLFEQFIKYNPNLVILDPACGSGNLLKPFKKQSDTIKTIGIDIKKDNIEGIDKFYKDNFLSFKKEFDDEVDFIICNPPFNNTKENKEWMKENKKGKALLPELFLDKMIDLFGEDIHVMPIVLFVPMGFRLNQRLKSKRWKKIRDQHPSISSIISLPLDVFPNVEFHNEILIYNTNWLDAHYMLPDKYVKKLKR
ncbi:MAG: N-6 DNA methylase [bacterium]